MTGNSHSWPRFWCRRGGDFVLAGDGFLLDPLSEIGATANPNVVPFEGIEAAPCLILLGEPGLGKTTALRRHYDELHARGAGTGTRTLWKDLNVFQSDTRLVRSVFEDPVFSEWSPCDGVLHLFLDSLDECLLRIDSLACLLSEELAHHPVTRLRLRLACRTAVWPALLERRLREMWGEEAVGVFELAPLRRCDVAEAAAANGIDPTEFLAEVERREASALAGRPVTLRFLLGAWQRGEGWPRTQVELYEQGCRQLCCEGNESRLSSRRAGDLTPKQRLAVAGRIAAVSIFCGRPVLWAGNAAEPPDGDLPLQELVGGSESTDGDEVQVAEAAVREVLDTGLFSTRGPERVGFSHRTYAEFLAADYLARRRLEPRQILSLVVHPGGEGRVVPQLQQAASWLATMVPSVSEPILRADPQVLLGSDASTMSDETRESLVGSLLRLFDAGSLTDGDWSARGRYRKLNHPRLVAQLRPYIADRSKNLVVRRVAIDIAEACDLRELQHLLADVALDRTDREPARKQAADALIRVGDPETKLRMRPLLTAGASDDSEDDLKGAALLGLWPEHLSVEELIAVLSPPKCPSYGGSYSMFLHMRLIPRLQPSGLASLLRWAAAQPVTPGPEWPQQFVEALLEAAWGRIDDEGVLAPYAEAVAARVSRYLPIPGIEEGADAGKRRRLAEALATILEGQDISPVTLLNSDSPLLDPDDLVWLIERAVTAPSEGLAGYWSRLARGVYSPKPDQVEAILRAMPTCATLERVFAPLFAEVAFDSPVAEGMREDYRAEQEWVQRRNLPGPILDPPPCLRVALLLDRAAAGDLDAWWRLNEELTLGPTSTHYGNGLESDIRALPGWRDADGTTRKRILQAAGQFLARAPCHVAEWLGTGSYNWGDMAAYRALLLIAREDIAAYQALPADLWRKWAAACLAYPCGIGTADDEAHQGLVAVAYHHAAEEVLRALLILIDQDNRNHDGIFILRKAAGCWDERLASAIAEKTRDPALKPSCMGSLLEELLRHDESRGADLAVSFVPDPLPEEGDGRSRAVTAAALLFALATGRAWTSVWPVMRADEAFGRDVITQVAQRPDQDAAALALRLTEEQTADLYLWIVRQFPPAQDIQHEGVYWMGPRENVSAFRDGVLQGLQRCGTIEAWREMERLADALPELSWLRWAAVETRTITLRRSWIPPTPQALLQLVCQRDRRLVESGEQLLEVVLESLRRLGGDLQGETPAAPDLWNRLEGDAFRPKSENEFSDYVARHLRRDIQSRGIVVNREVEIRRGEGKGEGERTDIHIDAVIAGHRPREYDRISVIVEVKGCWNRGLKEDMKGQLHDRYLRDNSCRHGLYLIGWFSCEQWDQKDYRKGGTPRWTAEQAQRHFDDQAVALSRDGVCTRALVLNVALR